MTTLQHTVDTTRNIWISRNFTLDNFELFSVTDCRLQLVHENHGYVQKFFLKKKPA